jgi:hypothetical protein
LQVKRTGVERRTDSIYCKAKVQFTGIECTKGIVRLGRQGRV